MYEAEAYLSSATAAQRAAVEQLLSDLDDLVVEPADGYHFGRPGDLVFDGTGADGPAVGYIAPDGSVSWVAGGKEE